MPNTTKIIGSEIALSSANTVDSATVVRIYNNSGGEVLLTRKDSDTNTIGTMTLANNAAEFLVKDASDTITSNTAVRATAVAFSS